MKLPRKIPSSDGCFAKPAKAWEPSLCILIPALLLLVIMSGGFAQSGAQQESAETGVGKVFYFASPLQTLDEEWSVLVTPTQDDTAVKLFRLKEDGTGDKVGEGTVSVGELFSYTGSGDERCYKLIADKPVVAVVCGGKTRDPVGWGQGATFYPDVEGDFVGRSFNLIPMSEYTDVYFVQDAEVTVTDSSGNIVDEWFAFKNSTKTVHMIPVAKPCTIESSGDVMVFSWWNNSATQVPSTEGSLVGRRFFVPQLGTGMFGQQYPGFVLVFGYEDAEVIAVSLKDERTIFTTTVKKGEYKYFYNLTEVTIQENMFSYEDLFISSSGLIGVWSSGSEGSYTLRALGDDILFVGGLDGEYAFHVPARGYLFAPDGMKVTINGEEESLNRDQYLELTTGDYVVKSEKPVIIEIIADPGSSVSGGAAPHNDWGNVLISYPYIEPTEPGGKEEIDYLTIGAAVAIVAIVAVIVLKKIRRS